MKTDTSARGTSRSRRALTAIALLAPILAAIVLWARNGSGTRAGAPASEPGSAAPPAAGSDPPPATSAGSREESRREAAPPAAPAPTVAPLAADELRAALRRLAQADMQDSAALEAALRPLFVPPDNVLAVLELLKANGLGDEESLTLEELGALRCLTLAVLVFNPPPGVQSTLASEGVSLDGRALVLAILRALPDIFAPEQEYLADMLGSQRDERGRAILDSSYAAELERLAAAYPEHAPLFERLLAGLLEVLDAADAAALQALYVSDADSPVLVAAGLKRWLEANAATALAWAESVYDQEETSDEIRRAISGAVALAAPVEDAAEFLSERAQRTMLLQFMALGERAGGKEALDDQYWNLRIGGDADDRARTMLVSGMTDATTEALLAIGQEDPSPFVRGQAWTTLTASNGFTPSQAVLDRLAEAWQGRNDPLRSVPTAGIVSAAGNFAGKAGQSPALREGAIDLLRTIVRDPSTSETDRSSALKKLERLVSAEEFLQLSRKP